LALSASVLKLKYTCSSVTAFALGTNAAASANAPAATNSEDFRNLIMLFPPMNCYCANSSGVTVLSVVFGMARLFFKNFLGWRLTRQLPLSRSNELPVDVAQLPSARFCETAIR
jgi:hypothetical protein